MENLSRQTLQKIKQVRKTLLKAIGIEMRDQKMLSELNPTEIKGRRVFKRWGKQENIGQLCLLTDFTQRKNKLSFYEEN